MKRTWLTDLLWMLVLLLITAFLVIPHTRQIFIQLTNNHPYGMGFIKFAILASMGELLALRLAAGAWEKPGGFVFKVIVWGVIGVLITFMFSLYSAGVTAILQPATPPNGFLSALLIAFLTSATMNLTFGIVFMAAHRISDAYIELRLHHKKPSFHDLVQTIDWNAFITFVVGKTIPLFWVPAHTIVFMLPNYLRVIVAAYLSIALGMILAYSKHRKGTA
ncbi:MAG TPA: hypothetical protein PLA02_06005 [Brevefilum fermentans]|uniref:Mpv17/PMP22 n=1 Tax=Candidatus Brevifilum fermentans TaxID=1986204 RepID=A0A1Y6K4S1_9CHLR|nr:hypothetical protein [Brevefilum fermentans]MDI9565766.1 hypothetical protein [Chloroflexota bacterium]OQB83289.1 MAG: hypothetical protein BWX85_01340 [Chloroflexi bacterium ADurb.Bin120]SMX53858.1 Mpv17/PMP22 [Brevefilum fermentans]HOM68122.1 hypothetical protein [Brevefilum fermentans]HPX95422.1 hypothetical protein [Brevefilum fermentans]